MADFPKELDVKDFKKMVENAFTLACNSISVHTGQTAPSEVVGPVVAALLQASLQEEYGYKRDLRKVLLEL